MNIKLSNDDLFILFAAKHYDNPQMISIEDFRDDLKRFNYIKRLLGKFERGNELRERLILNHIIVLYNVFGNATTKMLYSRLFDYKEIIKPFLIFLNQMPEVIKDFYDKDIHLYSSDIKMDQEVVEILRNI